MGDERTTTTLKSDMIVPEVFGDIVTAKFKGKLVIANFALTDTTLVGNLRYCSVTKWNQSRDAEDRRKMLQWYQVLLSDADAPRK